MRIWRSFFLVVGLLFSLCSGAATQDGYYLKLIDSYWRTADGSPVKGVKKSDDQICWEGGRCYRLFSVSRHWGQGPEVAELMNRPKDSGGRVELDDQTGRTLYRRAQRKFWRMLRNSK